MDLLPIDVLTSEEATKIKEEIEYIEKKWPDELMSKENINIRIKANNEISKIFYNDAKQQGKY